MVYFKTAKVLPIKTYHVYSISFIKTYNYSYAYICMSLIILSLQNYSIMLLQMNKIMSLERAETVIAVLFHHKAAILLNFGSKNMYCYVRSN